MSKLKTQYAKQICPQIQLVFSLILKLELMCLRDNEFSDLTIQHLVKTENLISSVN